MDSSNIKQYLKAKGLTDPQLIEDLTEHLLEKIKAIHGSGHVSKLDELMEDIWPAPNLKELENLALIYANPKLYLMKKLAVIIGLLSSMVFLAGALFKFNHWAGTLQVITLGYLLIGLFVFPYFWWKQYHYSLIDKAVGLGKNFNLLMCIAGFLASEFMLAGIHISLFNHIQPLGLNLSLISALILLLYIPMYWLRQYRLWSIK